MGDPLFSYILILKELNRVLSDVFLPPLLSLSLGPTGEYSAIMEQDGSGVGKNVLRVPLTRADLGTNLTCVAENAAMTIPFTASVTVDVNGESQPLCLVPYLPHQVSR